jgi:hypothetical protein
MTDIIIGLLTATGLVTAIITPTLIFNGFLSFGNPRKIGGILLPAFDDPDWVQHKVDWFSNGIVHVHSETPFNYPSIYIGHTKLEGFLGSVNYYERKLRQAQLSRKYLDSKIEQTLKLIEK